MAPSAEPGPAGPLVHLVCGLNGAGKTTYARELERAGAVRFTLDEWMIALWPGLRFDQEGWLERAERCRGLIWASALQVLARGVDVVLDWNLWDSGRRAPWAGVARSAGYEPLLHHVVADASTAVERAAAREAHGAYDVTDAEVRHLAALFVAPGDGEGIQVVRVGPEHAPFPRA